MKKKTAVLLIIYTAILFGICGFGLGRKISIDSNAKDEAIIETENSIDHEKEALHMAYRRGWSHWFSGYGMKGEGIKYIDYYEYGRSYDADFKDEKEAFGAGYCDGFYYVNHSETSLSENALEGMFRQYYPE